MSNIIDVEVEVEGGGEAVIEDALEAGGEVSGSFKTTHHHRYVHRLEWVLVGGCLWVGA